MNVKILVCCHEPSVLPKDSFLVPINGGRALLSSKLEKKQITKEQYDWMLENTIGDDTGDNISNLNPYFCELTVIYWAWKNYSDLGNPDYIGLSHYRRLFDTNDDELEDFISDNDIIGAFAKVSANCSILEEFNRCHRPENMQHVFDCIKDDYPQYLEDFKEYLDRQEGYFFNMFVMKKEIFFEYCEFLFSIIMKIHKISDYNIYSAYGSRLQGFIAERLTGIFIHHKKKKFLKIKDTQVKFINNVKLVKELLPIKKDEYDKSFNIILASDDNYCSHLETTIISVLENGKISDLYCFYVINKSLSTNNKQALKTLETRYKNAKIIFVQIDDYLDDFFKYNVKVSTALNHISIETFYRIYIPKIFKNFDKVLWLDCDLVVNHDLSDLFSIDICNKQLAACLDIELARMRAVSNGEYDNYLKNEIGLRNPNLYFQAGVILFNVQECIKKDFLQHSKDIFLRFPELRNNDQDLLNIVCQGDVHYLDPRWNYEWHVEFQTSNIKMELSLDFYEKLVLCKQDPFIVHFSSCWKPWKDVNYPYAYLYWKFAAKSILSIPNIISNNCIQNNSKVKVHEERTEQCKSYMIDEFDVNKKYYFIKCQIISLKRKYILWSLLYYLVFFIPFMSKKIKSRNKLLKQTIKKYKRKKSQFSKNLKILKNSKFFDADWYVSSYENSNEPILDPFIHYLEIGWIKGYSPSPLFDGNQYLNDNIDVSSSNINPLVHYELFGKKEGRMISSIK